MKYLIILLSFFILSCNNNNIKTINSDKEEYFVISNQNMRIYVQFIYFTKDSCSWITNIKGSVIHDPKCKNHETKCKY
jgi:thioredoxin-related protein